MSKKIRVGVIGLGIMGEQYTRIYESHPFAEVGAIATRNPERLRRIGDKYGIAARYLDYHEMLSEGLLDAVCVATPDFAHHAPVKAALEAGLHVLCEKPFTTDLQEADALLALSRSRPKQKLQVAFNHRWLAAYHQGFASIRDGSGGQRHDYRHDSETCQSDACVNLKRARPLARNAP